MIGKAEKPVVIAGTGVWQSGAGDDLIEFIEGAGLPVLTSLSGRGTIPDTDPLCFEVRLRSGRAAVFRPMAGQTS